MSVIDGLRKKLVLDFLMGTQKTEDQDFGRALKWVAIDITYPA